MKKLSFYLGISLIISVQLINAQNIFKQYGFNKEPLTLSDGRYNEFFTNDKIVQIGTVLLNTETNKITAFVEEDTAKVNYLSELSSRWLSIDPLAAKYPQVSPYVYVKNNPIIRIDPDGKEDFIVIQVKNSNETNAESQWLIYPTGTFDNYSYNDLSSMSADQIINDFGTPQKTRMGSSLPDNPTESDNDNTGNATAKAGRYTYEKGQFQNEVGSEGLPVLFLDEGKGKGVVSTEFENHKQDGKKIATGVAAHAGRTAWQKEVSKGETPTENKGSAGCPTTTGFNDIYNNVEAQGNFIIIRNQEQYEENK